MAEDSGASDESSKKSYDQREDLDCADVDWHPVELYGSDQHQAQDNTSETNSAQHAVATNISLDPGKVTEAQSSATQLDAITNTHDDQQLQQPLDHAQATAFEPEMIVDTYDQQHSPQQNDELISFHPNLGTNINDDQDLLQQILVEAQSIPLPCELTQEIPHDQQPAQPFAEAQLAEEQELVPDEIDSDSAIGSDVWVFESPGSIILPKADADGLNRQSTTTSLSESIWNYRKEHGRTYHAYKDGKYIFPNDEREADRLDLQHHLFWITYAERLFFAPLNNPKRCLDVGTGTGIWAVDFADQFPDCQVIGTDLSPGQPTLVPPNLKFVIDDAEDFWIYDQKFDFIHLRLMAGTLADWPAFFRQAYDNLEPGGWLELQDYGLPVKSADGTADNTDLMKWGELLCEAARELGRPMGSDVADHYEEWMHAAGFVDIKKMMFMWPSNGWPKDPFMKELGRWNQTNILEGLEGFCLALLTRGLGWQKEEVDVFVAKVSNDFRDRKIHAYFPMPVAWARKPYPWEVVFH